MSSLVFKPASIGDLKKIPKDLTPFEGDVLILYSQTTALAAFISFPWSYDDMNMPVALPGSHSDDLFIKNLLKNEVVGKSQIFRDVYIHLFAGKKLPANDLKKCLANYSSIYPDTLIFDKDFKDRFDCIDLIPAFDFLSLSLSKNDFLTEKKPLTKSSINFNLIFKHIDDCNFRAILMDNEDKDTLSTCLFTKEEGRPKTYISQVYTKQSHRGCGLGKLSLSLSLDKVFYQNTDLISLNVMSVNTAALQLYKSLGFKISDSLSFYSLDK